MALEIRNFSCFYGDRPVLEEVSTIPYKPGYLHTVIGPNGTGKSSFFKSLVRMVKCRGEVFLYEEDLDNVPKTNLNSYLFYLPSDTSTTAQISVFETLILTRKQGKDCSSWRCTDEDLEGVASILEKLKIEHLSDCYISELSSGQRQMVSIAQALLKEPKVLLLDEPTSTLDLHHQIKTMEIIRNLTREKNIITLIAIHDLNLASRYGDTITVFKSGRLFCSGTVGDILTRETVEEVYSIRAQILWEEGRPYICPVGVL